MLKHSRFFPLILPLFLGLVWIPVALAADAGVSQVTAPLSPADAAPAPAAGEQRRVTPEELFATLSKAAAEGQGPAMYDLGVLYERGLGTTRNFTLAVQWYQKAADAGVAGACQQLGLAYERGQGVAVDQKKADDNFQKAASLKLPEASYRLALRTLASPPAKGTEQKALDTLKAAGQSSAQAQETLGTFYEQGLVGGAPNFTKALEWYEKAAKAGLAQAYFRAGVCYELGLGTPANFKTALANFQSAADRKIPEASYKLAALSQLGGDSAKALEYLKQAANEGHALATNELGVIYLQGQLNQKADPAQALALFTKSAEQGNPEAMKNVAVMYKDGLGGRKPDPAQALKWYLIAHQSGYQPQSLAPIIADLKKSLNETQIKQSETDAAQWLTSFAQKRQAAQ